MAAAWVETDSFPPSVFNHDQGLKFPLSKPSLKIKSVGVDVGVTVDGSGVLVGVLLTGGVLVFVAVAVREGVGVFDGVRVIVGVRDGVNVLLGVKVMVLVAGFNVAVAVAVFVGAKVAVLVDVGV